MIPHFTTLQDALDYVIKHPKEYNPDMCFSFATELLRKQFENMPDIAPFKTTSTFDMHSMATKPFPYLIDRLVPESAITSLTADSGAGKSLVAMIMAQSIATGKSFLSTFKTKKTKILLIDQEMDSDLLIGRVKALSDTPIEGISIMYEQTWSIDKKDDFNWLVKEIKNKKYGLVIFDTLTMIHSAEENNSMEMKKVNQLMLELIAQTGVTIMYLHHHRKQMKGEKNGMASSRGSTEIIAKVSSHLQIESKKLIELDEHGKETVILEIKISQEKERRPEGITKIGVNVVYSDGKTTWEYKGVINEDEAAIEKAKEMVVEMFEKLDALKSKEIIQSCLEDQKFKIGLNNLGIALRRLEDENIIEHFNKKQLLELGELSDKEKDNFSSRAYYYRLKK